MISKRQYDQNRNEAYRKYLRGLLKDSDRDGFANIFDCSPFDPRRQDIKPNVMIDEELKKLPIYFTTTSNPTNTTPLYHYSDKNIPKKAYLAKMRFLSIVKKRPDVIGEIKRKGPSLVVFTSHGGIAEDALGLAYPDESYVLVRLTGRIGVPYRRTEIDEGAGTIIHEMEHIRQFKSYEKKPKLMKKMFKGRYEKRPGEIQADEAERKAFRKRYQVLSYHSKTGERIRKMFQEMTE